MLVRLLDGLTMYTVNVQNERKNLIDDLPPVGSAGKLTDGLLSTLYCGALYLKLQVSVFILTVIMPPQ